jgi:hypothetical protein
MTDQPLTTRRFVPGPGPTPFLECPCGAALRDHVYTDLARVPAESAEREKIEGWIDYHEWTRLPFPSVREGSDLIVFRALRCPGGGGAVAPLGLAATVLEDDMLRGTLYMLAAYEVDAISTAGEPWRAYSESWAGRDAALE